MAVALLATTLATGAALVALILTFTPISGAHFNPAVSIADASPGRLSGTDAGAYSIAQLVGAFLGHRPPAGKRQEFSLRLAAQTGTPNEKASHPGAAGVPTAGRP